MPSMVYYITKPSFHEIKFLYTDKAFRDGTDKYGTLQDKIVFPRAQLFVSRVSG